MRRLARAAWTLRLARAFWLPAILLLALACTPPVVLPTPTQAPAVALSAAFPLPSLSSVVKQVTSSVVYIYVETDPNSASGGLTASGSGVIMLPEGYILTNRHVVENAARVEVTLQDLQVFEASGIWVDDIMDLAVVKINGLGLPAARFADTSTLQVGDWVVAIGHALGLSPRQGGPTVTAGVVSNLGRSFSINQVQYYDVIQTDAAINPGNSGGPLVNLSGEVVGINSADAAGENIGYAINVATARHCFEDLVRYGKPHHPYLGIDVRDITPPMANRMALPQRTGAVITTVQAGGPAEQAGLTTRDVITALNGVEVKFSADLVRELWRLDVGDTVTVTLRRGALASDTTIVLGERPPNAVGV